MRNDGHPGDRALARQAAYQHGIVSLAQLAALGIGRGAVAHRVRMGRLHRVAPGVYAVGHPRLTPFGSALAAVLSVGADAVLSHLSAAAAWGVIDEWPEDTHVTVPRKLRSRDGIRVHAVRSLERRDRRTLAGIPITSASRTLLDLTDVADDDTLTRAVGQAQVKGRVTENGIRAELEQANGRRGAARLAALISDGPAPTRSKLEDVVLELLRKHGLPRPQINVRVAGFEVDFLFAEARLIVEADGARYHDNRISRRRDARKQAQLEAAGYRVLRLDWNQVTRQPTQTVTRLRQALRR